jgi:hypothetical protein
VGKIRISSKGSAARKVLSRLVFRTFKDTLRILWRHLLKVPAVGTEARINVLEE